MTLHKNCNNEWPDKSICFNTLKHRQIIIISLLGFIIISISLVLFFSSLSKTYIGITLHLIEDDWVVQSLDSSGLGAQAGIKTGDAPITINGQPANEFLQVYEKQKQCLGSTFTDLTVVNTTGQTISVNVENSSPPPQYIIEVIPYLVVCIIFWLTAYYVFFNKPKRAIAILLLLCSLAFGLALIGNVAAAVRIPGAVHLAVIGTTLGPWLLLHFFLFLSEEENRLRNNPYIYLIYLPAIITLILYPFIGYANGETTMGFRSIRSIELAIAFLAVIGVAIYNYISAVSPKTRQQMKILLYFCIAALAPFLILSILPSMVSGDILIPSSYSIIFISLIPLGMGYVVITQKLLDITIFIRRGFIYGTITLVIAAIFSLVIIFMFFYVKTLSIAQGIIIALLLSILASILYGPIRTGMENLVNKYIYKDKYDYRKTIQEMGAALNSIAYISEGSSLVVNTLVEKLNLKGGCLFTTSDNGTFDLVVSTGILAESERQQQLMGLLCTRKSSIVFPNSTILANPDVEFLIPLIAGGKEIGGICLSPKTTKQRYSADDLFLIQGLAPVVAVSLRSWIIIALDITERKRTEDKLRNAAEEWQITFDSIPMPISLQSKNFRILRVNKAYADLYNINADDIVGQPCYKLVHKTNNPVENCPNIKMLATNKSAVAEIYDDVLEKYFEITTSPIINSHGEITDSVHIMRDITQIKKSEEEKRQMQEKAEISSRLASVGEMAAGIAHEINNPLTGVIGFSDMLLERNLPQDMKEQVEIIADGSRRVADIVKRLLTFARQHKPLKTLVSINSLIENTLNMRIYVMKTNSITVNTSFDTEIPLIVVDPGQIQQVLLNLIINAEYSMKKADRMGELTISTKLVGSLIQISFKDNGIGISPENIKRLFQPFFTTKPIGEGTGLGLSLAHAIIAEHKGTITVESKLDKGTIFNIELPIIDDFYQTNAVEEKLPQATVNLNKLNILVVDDELTVQQFIKSTLDPTKYDVDTTKNPNDVIERFSGKNYHLIIIDIKMPGISGLELYTKLFDYNPLIAEKVLFITGDISNLEAKHFLQKNNLPSLAKPFDHKTLVAKIHEIVKE